MYCEPVEVRRKEDRVHWQCRVCGFADNAYHAYFPDRIHAPCRKTGIPKACGPGCQLKKLLSLLGIKATPGCKCNQRARKMDLHGSDWCASNVETIVGWLKEAAQEQGLPFSDFLARRIIHLAIRLARKAERKQ